MEVFSKRGASPPAYEEIARKEWIITNGIGGYASSTIAGLNTRRYHGLLVASFNPPTERMVLVSKIDEVIFHNGQDISLTTNRYHNNTIHPEGYRFLHDFRRLPLPTTRFVAGDASLEKTIFMVYNSNTTVIEYRNTSASEFLLKLNPHYVHRDYHGLQHEQLNYDYQVKHRENTQLIYAFYGAEAVAFKYSDGTFFENRYWNRRLEYEIDRERGQDHLEDIYSIGHVEKLMQPGETLYLVFSTEEKMLEADPVNLKEAELLRLSKIAPVEIKNQFFRDLLTAGEQFIVQRRTTDNYSIIAGYHWFTDWGRDSMIVIRGLCIAAGRQQISRSVITTFLSYLKQGIIPNRFPDYKGDMAEYNTVDATLWLFVAIYEYHQKFGDDGFLAEVFPRLHEIIDHHLRGTMYNIQVTDKGFLTQGSPDIQLTWMDARIRDVVFTPRQGCPVEINALWYNAMRIYEYVAENTGQAKDERIVTTRQKFEQNFLRSFWNRDGYLNDLVTEDRKADTAVRPNQIYAVSLPFSLLPEKEERFVVESVRKKLLTPYGLRTLDPHHPDFKPEYSGDVWLRDAAYHQGTVWPFLLPEYFLAFLKVNKYSDEAREQVREYLLPLKEHFYTEGCIHGISEIFDGLNPSKGKGCMHQAWSVSNLILLLTRSGIEL